MTLVHRVLYPNPIISLEEYLTRGGGKGLEAALEMTPAAIIERVLASGLRGRGGAGFPTGRKWQTVAAEPTRRRPRRRSSSTPPRASRARSRTAPSCAATPTWCVEGALIAARAVRRRPGRVRHEAGRSRARSSGCGTPSRTSRTRAGTTASSWSSSRAPTSTSTARRAPCSRPSTAGGPSPASSPPSAGACAGGPARRRPQSRRPWSTTSRRWPTWPASSARGPDWFRTMGTKESPGTIVCTVTGRTQRHGVGEVQMGTPLREVIEEIGGGPLPGPADQGRAVGRGQRDHHRRPARHAGHLRAPGRHRQRPRVGRRSSCSTTRST